MKKYTSIFLAALCLSFILIAFGCGPSANNGTGSGVTGPTPTPPDKCSLMTDEEITAMIYGRIVMGGMGSEVKQIDIITKNRAVVLLGWVKDDAEKQKVIDYAKNSCSLSVDSQTLYVGSNNPTHPPGGCVPPYTKCGDICVANGTECSISDLVPAPVANSNSSNSNHSSNTNSHSNSSMNANSNHR
jgi:hypothetical protein